MMMNLHDSLTGLIQKPPYLIFFRYRSLNSGIVCFTGNQKIPITRLVLNFGFISRATPSDEMNIRELIKKAQQSALTIPVIYSVFGYSYIWISHTITFSTISDYQQINLLNSQTLLRLVFILFSSVILYFLIHSFHKKIQTGASTYLQLFHNHPHPMWVFDIATLRFLAVNEAAIVKYGYSQSEFLSKTIKDIRPNEDLQRLAAEKSYKSGFNLSGTWRHQLKNGKVIDVEISTYTLNYEGHDAKLTLAYDVTDRIKYEHQIIDFSNALEKRVEERTAELHQSLQEQASLTEELETYNEELMSTNEQLVEAHEIISEQTENKIRQTEYRLEQVLQSVKDFVWAALVKEGILTMEMMSPAVEDLFGFSQEEYLQNPEIWFSVIAEEDQDKVRKMMSGVGRLPYEEMEYCIRQPKTWQVKYVLSRIWVTKISKNVYQINGIISDVSERKKQEEEKSSLIKQLITQNNDLLQFSYIASHNLRGPVATLLGLINLVEKEESPSEIKAISRHLLYSARKLDEVIADLTKILEIRNLESLPKSGILLRDIIDNIKETLFVQLQNNDIVIVTDFSAIDTFFTVKTYLYSILYNLISNSIKYRSPDRPAIIRITSFKTENTAGFTVSDNGLGLEMEKFQHKLFKLYQRFHTHVDGKGLGLYLVKTQTIALGGEIDVKSTLGEGTSFTITLPLHHEILVHSSSM